MLTKTIGTSTIITMSPVPQTVFFTSNLVETYNGLQNQRLPVKMVRIATMAQPAVVSFSTTTSLGAGMIIPAQHAEHFAVSVSTATGYNYVSIISGGSGGSVSITPVA